MKEWSLKEMMTNFNEQSKSLDIGDNIAVLYRGSFQPIKINGVTRGELKSLKGSYCIYDMDEKEYFNHHEIEMIAIEEYSDSPNSIYINELGEVDSDEYKNIHTIEIGDEIILKVTNNKVTHYEIKRRR